MAQLKMDTQTYDSLSVSEKAQIEQILRGTHLLGPTDTISAPVELSENIGGVWCKLACEAAEGLAEKLCSHLSNPTAKQVCVMAAKASEQICIAHCG